MKPDELPKEFVSTLRILEGLVSLLYDAAWMRFYQRRYFKDRKQMDKTRAIEYEKKTDCHLDVLIPQIESMPIWPNISESIHLIRQCRDMQNLFFQFREKNYLHRAKELERKVDELLDNIYVNQKNVQTKLF